jgi:signal transduction histidine kinase
MDVTEAETGVMRLDRQPTDLVQLLVEVAELYAEVAAEKNLTVAVDRAAACPAWVDPARLRQVFANLLDNALKYTPADGRVVLSAALESDETAVVTFRDTGIGIPTEEQPKIWTRLYRGDKSRSQRGLGLGLSLVKAIVEAHGGSVSVRSQPGAGAEFTVRVPRCEKAAPRAGAAVRAEVVRRNAAG